MILSNDQSSFFPTTNRTWNIYRDIDTDTHIHGVHVFFLKHIHSLWRQFCLWHCWLWILHRENVLQIIPDRPKHRCVKKNVLMCGSMCETHVHWTFQNTTVTGSGYGRLRHISENQRSSITECNTRWKHIIHIPYSQFIDCRQLTPPRPESAFPFTGHHQHEWPEDLSQPSSMTNRPFSTLSTKLVSFHRIHFENQHTFESR